MAFGRWNRRPELTLTGMADEEEGSAGLSRELAFFKVAHLIEHEHTPTLQMFHTPAASDVSTAARP